MGDAHPFLDDELPDQPGWRRWQFSDPTRFNQLLGPMAYRVEGSVARVRWTAERRHSNLSDHVHGGALLAFADVSLFAAARGFGLLETGTAVTLTLDAQFVGAAVVGEPLEARVDLLRETRRLLFLRGLVVQREAMVLAFSATVRKPAAAPA